MVDSMAVWKVLNTVFLMVAVMVAVSDVAMGFLMVALTVALKDVSSVALLVEYSAIEKAAS